MIVKKVRRREPETAAYLRHSALVLLVLLLALLLPSDGADQARGDDTVASNPYWRPGEITAPAQLAQAEDFSYGGLVLNEDGRLVLHFEPSRPIDEANNGNPTLTAAAMPVLDPRYHGRPYPVPAYIYLTMWHQSHHWSYYRLTRNATGEDDPEDPTELPEGGVVIPEPSALLLILMPALFPALRRCRRPGVR